MASEMRPLKLAATPLGSAAGAQRVVSLQAYETDEFKEGKAPLPFFVTVGSAEPCVNVFGILLHVTAWVMAVASDSMVLAKVDPNADSSVYSDKQFFDYILASFVPFLGGFILVLVGIVAHWVMQCRDKDGVGFSRAKVSDKSAKVPKSVEAVLKGAVASAILFAFVVLQFDQSNIKDQTDAQTIRTFLIIGMVSKIMVRMFLVVNFGQTLAFVPPAPPSAV